MSLPLDRLYPIIVLATLLGGVMWLERISSSGTTQEAGLVRQEPDLIAEKSTITRFDKAGFPLYRLEADKITHYPATQISELEEPRLRHTADQRVLYVKARYGEARKDGEEVFLSGDVSLVRDGQPGEKPMTLDSATLTVWPDTEKASTDDPVILTQGKTIARGKAMRTDNLFGTLQLIGSASVNMPSSRKK